MDIQEIIASHTDTIVNGNFSSPDIVCRNCHQKPEAFKLHESRKRKLRLIVEDIVKVSISFLLRWKCLFCGTTFTEYPPFVVPHKRFVLIDIINFGEKYLGNDDLSYRDVVKHDEANICYPDANGLCNQFLSHSTIWRFIGYLADMYQTSRKKLRISGGKMPLISPSKYRSRQRRVVLARAFQTILMFGRRQGSEDFPLL